jgi:hypothetical protein
MKLAPGSYILQDQRQDLAVLSQWPVRSQAVVESQNLPGASVQVTRFANIEHAVSLITVSGKRETPE